MGSVSDFVKCPKCGKDADHEYWYHTGEYSDNCRYCGWRGYRMLEFNSENRLFSKNIPIDKNILDITLPSFSDTGFYEESQKRLKDDRIGKNVVINPLYPDRFEGRTDFTDIYGAAALLIDPIRKYIADAVVKEPDIKDYADKYSKQVPNILYMDINSFLRSDFVNNLSGRKSFCQLQNNEGSDEQSDFLKHQKYTQAIYELYLIETEIFDKYKHTRLSELTDDHNDGILYSDDRDDWTVYPCKRTDYIIMKYIDICDIISRYRRDSGYITYAFWYINSYISSALQYEYHDFNYDMLDKINRAANNADYACGRFSEYDSDDIALCLPVSVRDKINKERFVVGYVMTTDENEKADCDVMRESLISMGYKYPFIISDKDKDMSFARDGFRMLLRFVNDGRPSRIVVKDKKDLMIDGFDVIDYFCYLNHIDLIVLNEPDREKIKDPEVESTHVASVSDEECAAFMSRLPKINIFEFPDEERNKVEE